MPWLLDILFGLIFILVIVIGVQRGFVRSIWGTVTLVGAFIIAYLFGPAFGTYICENYILKYVTEYVHAEISGISASGGGLYDISALFDNLPEQFTELISNCGADIESLEMQFNDAVTVSRDELFEFATDIARPISITISHALAIVLIFIVSLLALWLIGLVVKAIVKCPIIRSLDRFLGFLFSILNGIVIVWMISIILGIFVEKGFMEGESAEALYKITSSSYIFNFFCDLSPIDFININ